MMRGAIFNRSRYPVVDDEQRRELPEGRAKLEAEAPNGAGSLESPRAAEAAAQR